MQPEQTNIRLASVCLCTPMNSTNPVLLTRCKLSYVSNPLRLLRVMRCAGNIRPLTLPSYAHPVPPAGKVLSSFFSMYILSSCTEREGRKESEGVECSTDRVVINTGGKVASGSGQRHKCLRAGARNVRAPPWCGIPLSSTIMVWNTIPCLLSALVSK